jgi:hypothetical protein
MVYYPRPGHESSRRARDLKGNPAFQLVLLDREDRLLLSVAPQVTPRGCGSADDAQLQGVRGELPLRPDAVAYELRQGQVRLFRAAIPPAPPKFARPVCDQSAYSCTLHWQPCESHLLHEGSTGSGATGAPHVTYSIVAAMDSGRRITVARNLKDLTYTVDLAVMPVAGKGRLYLVASDGVRSTEVKAASIDVPARSPRLHILTPASGGASIRFGHVVSLLGCCLDMSGRPYSPADTVWYVDGERIASGTLIAAHAGLQPGSHRISFALEPAGIKRVETSIVVEVDAPDAQHREWEALMRDQHSVAGVRNDQNIH